MTRLLTCAVLLAISTVPNPAQNGDIERKDPRLERLRSFLEKAGSPILHLAEHFLHAADRYRLDWRLLPSISLVESGAGKQHINNNIFGWAEGRQAFETVEAGIYLVASRLGLSKLYRSKDLDEMLATYNPRIEWGTLVKSQMLRVDSREPLRARLPVEARVNPLTALQSTDRPGPAR